MRTCFSFFFFFFGGMEVLLLIILTYFMMYWWQAEIDRRKGMGVMLFQVEASLDDLVCFWNLHLLVVCTFDVELPNIR